MQLHPPVHQHLEVLGVEYEVLECEPELADTAAFCAAYGVDPADSANSILIASKRPPGALSVCIALATTRLDVNHRVRDLLGVKKLSFASADQTMEVTGMMIGGVTAFGLPRDLRILVDGEVMTRERIVLGGGNRTSKLALDPQVLNLLEAVEVHQDLAVPITD